jgi:hypothetical protein
MNRRKFFEIALKATAVGILVPEHLLEPLKGRSMISVPALAGSATWSFEDAAGNQSFIYMATDYVWPKDEFPPEPIPGAVALDLVWTPSK